MKSRPFFYSLQTNEKARGGPLAPPGHLFHKILPVIPDHLNWKHLKIKTLDKHCEFICSVEQQNDSQRKEELFTF